MFKEHMMKLYSGQIFKINILNNKNYHYQFTEDQEIIIKNRNNEIILNFNIIEQKIVEIDQDEFNKFFKIIVVENHNILKYCELMNMNETEIILELLKHE
jgi:hypothetical protein